MRQPDNQTTVIRCHGCSRQMTVSTAHIKAAQRRGHQFITFCTKACNLKFVAIEGTKQQEEQVKHGN